MVSHTTYYHVLYLLMPDNNENKDEDIFPLRGRLQEFSSSPQASDYFILK